MKPALTMGVMILTAGCASALSRETNEALVRDLVTIRPFDGVTGFASPDGPRSYGWEAKQVLVERGGGAVPALVAALRDAALDATQKSIVRDALGDMGANARTAVPALVEGLAGSDSRTATGICMKLARIGPASGAAVPDLLRVLHERGDEVVTPTRSFGDIVVPETRLRTMIAATLGAIGPPAEAALPALADGASQTADAVHRRACRTAIRRILGSEPTDRH